MPALVPVAAPAAPQSAARSQALPQPPVEAPRTVVASADATTSGMTASGKPEAVRARGGWLIQIGAFDGEDEAKQHLSAAQLKAHAMLGSADPFTERVQKGDKALFRARFAGFDKDTAEAACKQLKRNDFECMALKD
jgi:D-alanyl-D-alanine carboxypeptidase